MLVIEQLHLLEILLFSSSFGPNSYIMCHMNAHRIGLIFWFQVLLMLNVYRGSYWRCSHKAVVSLSKRSVAVFSSRSLELDTQICGDLQKRGQSENLNRHAGKSLKAWVSVGMRFQPKEDKKEFCASAIQFQHTAQCDSVLSKAARLRWNAFSINTHLVFS